MPDIELGFSAPAVVVFGLLVIATSLAVLFYRYTLPPVSRRKRVVLSILRSLSLCLLLLLLCEPLLRTIVSRVESPLVAVLIDNSRSMSIVDRTGNRSDQLRSLLTSGNLRGQYQTLYYTFGTRLQETTGEALEKEPLTDSLFVDEESTNIAEALESLQEIRDKKNIRAVLIVSDGVYTEGINPVYPAEALGVPVYAVGIGDSLEQRDLVLVRVTTNDLVYAGTEAPVDVTIKSSGYGGERVEVTLSDGRTVLHRTRITLDSGTREYTSRLMYIPDGEGTRKFIVRVSSLPGELTTDNNQSVFFSKVLKSRLRVTMIAGAPSPDVAILKHTLHEDRNLSARSFTQRGPGEFYEGPLSAAALDSTDCIMTIGFPTVETTPAILNLVRQAALEKNIPLFFVWGASLDGQMMSELTPLLPFSIRSVLSTAQYVFPEPLENQAAHPVLGLGDAGRIERWRRLPPIFRTGTIIQAKPDATTLAVSRIRNVVTQDPLILFRRLNRQKVIAVTGYGLWRWRLMAQGSAETDHMLALFLSNSIRWLTTREDERQVKIVPEKEIVLQGEPVTFSAQVYDAGARPIPDARLTVSVQGGGRDFDVLLHPRGNGLYDGTLEGLASGDYTFRGTAQIEGADIGTDRGRFVVGERNLEFQETRMNPGLLRQMALRSGGMFFTYGDFSGLDAALKSQPSFTANIVNETTEHELWNWSYMMIAIVILLAVEWFLRKRSGML
ncbi:MAG: VWA domain-containing protein [Ignavibacteria bacterium]|nr:VWA domain-containing protein [Ignavibacteria bacterium]